VITGSWQTRCYSNWDAIAANAVRISRRNLCRRAGLPQGYLLADMLSEPILDINLERRLIRQGVEVWGSLMTSVAATSWSDLKVAPKAGTRGRAWVSLK